MVQNIILNKVLTLTLAHWQFTPIKTCLITCGYNIVITVYGKPQTKIYNHGTSQTRVNHEWVNTEMYGWMNEWVNKWLTKYLIIINCIPVCANDTLVLLWQFRQPNFKFKYLISYYNTIYSF